MVLREAKTIGRFGLAGLSLVLLAYIFVPNFQRAHCSNCGAGCKSNLKNLGTAMEMYATDFNGHYPRNLALLTPKYLKTLPRCMHAANEFDKEFDEMGPLGHFQTYKLSTGPSAPYNTPGFQDYYFIECAGENHARIGCPPGYPQYDAISGLVER